MATELDTEHVAELEHDMEKGYYHEVAAITVDYRKTLDRGGFNKKDAAAMAGDFHERLLKKTFGKK